MKRIDGLLILVALGVGCGERDERPAPAEPVDAGVAPEPPNRRPGRLRVRYESSVPVGSVEASLSDLGDNDLFKLADNRAVVWVDDARLASVRVLRDGEVFAEVDAPPEGSERLVVELPTRWWPEGIHRLRYVARLVGGEVRAGEEEVRVIFNVTSVGSGGDGRLWLGTFEFGLVAYDLGADPLDAADDDFTLFGGVPLFGYWSEPELPPADGPPQPSGLVVLTVVPDGNGVWVGTFAMGLTWLDPGTTIDDRSDDGVALFHPSFWLPPTEYGDFGRVLADTVSSVVPDGETGLWIGTFNGLYHLDHGGTPLDQGDDRWTHFPWEGRYDANIARLAVDEAGWVWIAGIDVDGEGMHRGNTAAVLDPGGTPSDPSDDRWGRLELPEGFPAEALTVAAGDDGRIWWGTSAGLFGLDAGGTPSDPSDDRWWRIEGLRDDDVVSLLPTAGGGLWVGSVDVCGGDGGGLSHVEAGDCDDEGCPPPAVVYTVADGLLDDDVASMTMLEDGTLAVGTFNFLAAPVAARLLPSSAEMDCPPSTRPERNLTPWDEEAADASGASGGGDTGVDGLTILRPGEDLRSKADDALTNL